MELEESIAWVDRFKLLIIRSAKWEVGGSPEDMKDIIQDAYEAAVIAGRISVEKGITFSPVFWRIFKRRKRREENSVDLLDCEPYRDENHYEFGSSFPNPEKALMHKQYAGFPRREYLTEFMLTLSENEKNVLAAVTGLHGLKLSYAEIEATHGITGGGVSQIVKRLTKKAEAFRKNGMSPEYPHRHTDEKETGYESERSGLVVRHTGSGYQEASEGRPSAGAAGRRRYKGPVVSGKPLGKEMVCRGGP